MQKENSHHITEQTKPGAVDLSRFCSFCNDSKITVAARQFTKLFHENALFSEVSFTYIVNKTVWNIMHHAVISSLFSMHVGCNYSPNSPKLNIANSHKEKHTFQSQCYISPLLLCICVAGVQALTSRPTVGQLDIPRGAPASLLFILPSQAKPQELEDFTLIHAH